MEYNSLDSYLKRTFGGKVYKLALSMGATCPNRDGTKGWGGCSFCSAGGSGDFAENTLSVGEQIELAKKRVDSKFPKKNDVPRMYIAYFQSFTSTYISGSLTLHSLRERLMAAALNKCVVAVSVGTRPDCLEPEVMQILTEVNQIKPVWVELGLQTVNEKTAAAFGRGYELGTFTDAYCRLKKAGLYVVVHVILGLPGESEGDMLETVRFLSGLTPILDGIKFQLLHVLRGTRLACDYEKGLFETMDFEEYCSVLGKCLKLIPKETVVHRITGDGPKRILIAPLWSADKKKVLNSLKKYLLSI